MTGLSYYFCLSHLTRFMNSLYVFGHTIGIIQHTCPSLNGLGPCCLFGVHVGSRVEISKGDLEFSHRYKENAFFLIALISWNTTIFLLNTKVASHVDETSSDTKIKKNIYPWKCSKRLEERRMLENNIKICVVYLKGSGHNLKSYS
jgi:hypothetical protein